MAESLSELEVAEGELLAGQNHLKVFLRGMFHHFTLIASSKDFTGRVFFFSGGFWLLDYCCWFCFARSPGQSFLQWCGRLPSVYQDFDRPGCNGAPSMGSKKQQHQKTALLDS